MAVGEAAASLGVVAGSEEAAATVGAIGEGTFAEGVEPRAQGTTSKLASGSRTQADRMLILTGLLLEALVGKPKR